MTTTILQITVSELCEREGVSRATVAQLVECEIARPVTGSSPEDWVFEARAVHWVKRAIRLQRDLEIDWITVATMIDLLQERERLRSENRCLRQRLQRFLAPEES